MRRKYILFALALTGALASCSDDDNKGTANYKNPYSNPLTDYSAADPTVWKENDHSFYVYATNTSVIRKSEDLIHWTDGGKMFATKPTFVTESGAAVWAPDIEKVGDKYILYFAMSAMGKPATAGIGIASADSPEGPFTLDISVDGKGKLFTSSEIDVRNSIDPCYFEDNGQKWLVWGSFNGLYAVKLNEDGTRVYPDIATAKKERVQVAGTAFEAPYIHKRGDYYYMFASVGSCCNSMLSTYTTVVGRSTSFLGPYVNKNGESMLDNKYEVLIRANDRFVGPGHNSEIVTDSEGNEWMLYHSYDRHTPSKGRYLMIDRIVWENDWPVIAGNSPSTEAEAPVCK